MPDGDGAIKNNRGRGLRMKGGCCFGMVRKSFSEEVTFEWRSEGGSHVEHT